MEALIKAMVPKNEKDLISVSLYTGTGALLRDNAPVI